MMSNRPLPAGLLAFRDFAKSKFLPFVTASSLDPDTKRYYATGWRLLEGSPAADWRLDQVTRSRADTLQFAGSGANQNCALRTLRGCSHSPKTKACSIHYPGSSSAKNMSAVRSSTLQRRKNSWYRRNSRCGTFPSRSGLGYAPGRGDSYAMGRCCCGQGTDLRRNGEDAESTSSRTSQ